MNKGLKLIAFVCVALVAATTQAAPKSGDVHGDWGTRCDTNPDGVEACFIFQNLNTKEGKRVLQVAIGYRPGQTDATALFTAPLGINLIPGVQIQIDEGEPRKLPVAVCDQEGCKAFLQVDAGLLSALKAGSKLKFTFATIQRQAFNVDVSLNGFTAGINTLKQ